MYGIKKSNKVSDAIADRLKNVVSDVVDIRFSQIRCESLPTSKPSNLRVLTDLQGSYYSKNS